VTDAAAVVRTLVAARLPAARPLVLGIAGGVAAGKSRLADDVRVVLTGVRAEVVATDGFLYPNAELTRRGLLARKGFPETYDTDRLRGFLTAVRACEFPQTVPTYSHDTYDVRDAARTVEPLDVLIIEGINVLATAADLLDVGVYLDAADDDLEGWYRERFVTLWAAGRDDPTSFYRLLADLDSDAVEALATRVCRSVNQVNLRDHIAPSRDLATCVIVKGSDHRVLRVTMRDDDATSGPSIRS
jgi:type I pantothenate kinase